MFWKVYVPACLIAVSMLGCSSPGPGGASSASAPSGSNTSHAPGHDHSDPKAKTDKGHDGDSHKHEHHGKHDDEDHSHEEAPATLAAAVDRLDDLHANIVKAFAAKDEKKADTLIHDAGHVLEHIPDLAKKASLSASDQAAIKKDVDSLFANFEKVDDKLHGRAGSSYQDVSGQVAVTLKSLRAKLTAK